MYWTDFRSLFTTWKRYTCRWWICTLFSNFQGRCHGNQIVLPQWRQTDTTRILFGSPDGSSVSFRYYNLGSVIVVLSGLLARFFHAFLCYYFTLSKAISVSSGPIFTIFSPNGRYLREFFWSRPVFPIHQGTLPWQQILCSTGLFHSEPKFLRICWTDFHNLCTMW